MCGDNITSVHLIRVLESAPDCTHCYCERCKQEFRIREGDKAQWREVFKRDTLQPGSNLYYKEYPHKMNVYE